MEYRLLRSRRKTIALRVCPDGTAEVRAPLTMSRKQIDAFVQKHQEWWSKTIQSTQRRRVFEREIDEKEPFLRKQAEEYLPRRTAEWAAVMGVRPTGIKITSAKTRFGSCSPKNGICYSWRLMAYPLKGVDYVIVHELAHILQKNHSAKFYAVVQKYLPDWKERRKLLQK